MLIALLLGFWIVPTAGAANENSARLGVRITDGAWCPNTEKSIDKYDGGICVLRVFAGSAAHQLGLQYGDLIVEFNARRFETADEFAAAVGSHKVGDPFRLLIVRDQDEFALDSTFNNWDVPGQSRAKIIYPLRNSD
ncbi:MAG: PDZ domain-containing protein [Gammaproteobacteria bacterium]